jgi:phage host-nuclease inhibitor protein Gam
MNDYIERFPYSLKKAKKRDNTSLPSFISNELDYFTEYIKRLEKDLEVEIDNPEMYTSEIINIKEYVNFLYTKLRDYADTKGPGVSDIGKTQLSDLEAKITSLNLKLQNLQADAGQEELNYIQRIILLNELGVIEHLLTRKEQYGVSTNGTAKIIAKIIGSSPSNVNSYLRFLQGEDSDEKYNPYKTPKNVEKVQNLLISNNFKLKST